MKTRLTGLFVGLALAASASIAMAQETVMRIGFFPGPYADQFTRGIQPMLEKQGIKIEKTEFSNAIQPNTALMDGSLDVNIFQNDGFRNLFNEQNSADLVTLLHIPSAPLGLYSNKVKSIAEITDGMRLAVPNDPTNLGRALAFLETQGLIKLKEGIDFGRATEKDIGENPKNLEVIPLDAPQIMRAMEDVDVAAALGNHVLAAGRSLSEAMALEDPAKQYQIIIVSRDGSKDTPWAKALVEAYKSPEFRQFVEADPMTKGFSTPEYWR